MKKISTLSTALFLFNAAYAFGAEKEILTIESTITGSQEQPKVMVIVPWKAPTGPEDLQDSIIAGVIEKQLMEPIDREVFLRRIDYFQQLHPTLKPVVSQE